MLLSLTNDFPLADLHAVYHVHEKALSADGNCSSAGAHLSPYTSQYPCLDIDHPENCEAGDLSGKHGGINGTSFSGK